jgi:predicted nucleic acid-binding protein
LQSRRSAAATPSRPFFNELSIQLAIRRRHCGAVGLVELVHGIHRADTAERRTRREAFVDALIAAVAVYPLGIDVAKLAGKLDAEQQSRGVVIPFADLLIGATALSVRYSVLTANPRHFRRIPDLTVIQL